MNLLDHFGLRYQIRPPDDLPFPIALKGRPDPLEGVDLTQKTVEEVFALYREVAAPVSLRDLVDRGFACSVGPDEFTYKEPILAVAQQIGSAHEDEKVDEANLHMEDITITSYCAYGRTLVDVGTHALAAGKGLMAHLAESGPFAYQEGDERS